MNKDVLDLNLELIKTQARLDTLERRIDKIFELLVEMARSEKT